MRWLLNFLCVSCVILPDPQDCWCLLSWDAAFIPSWPLFTAPHFLSVHFGVVTPFRIFFFLSIAYDFVVYLFQSVCSNLFSDFKLKSYDFNEDQLGEVWFISVHFMSSHSPLLFSLCSRIFSLSFVPFYSFNSFSCLFIHLSFLISGFQCE